MTDEEIVERVRGIVAEAFAAAPGSHDGDHTTRVAALCERLGPAEGCDMTVLRLAALLHDVGRPEQDASGGTLDHAERGAARAETILAGLPLAPGRSANVVHCIRAHRFRGERRPETVEARVLFDADKLDSIGAIGVARAFLFSGEVGARLHAPGIDVTRVPEYSRDDTGYREYVVKLSKVRERMLTDAGRALAEGRHAFLAAFFDRFLAEHDGRC